MAQFTKGRFQARLYAFCWTILETRQSDFDSEKMKEQNWIVTVLQAMNYATEQEKDVIKKLSEVIKHKDDVSDEQASMIGALEGKYVIYKNKYPQLLLMDCDIMDDDISTPKKEDTANSNSRLLMWIIIGVIFLGILIYNLPVTQEWIAYKAITRTTTIYESQQAVKEYIAHYPKGKHIEDVYYRNVMLNASDETCIMDYIRKFPNGAHLEEVKRLYEDVIYHKIMANGYRMADVMAYLNKFPEGSYANDVNRICDSIWDSEIAKYHSKSKAKGTQKAVKYFDAMLEYMKQHRVNVLSFTTKSKISLKDYSEYDEGIRELVELFYSRDILPISGNVVSIKKNFSAQDQAQLNTIINEGLQKSLDEIFTAGFIQVAENDGVINVNGKPVSLPGAQFDYVIKSQEDVLGGKSYPHLWTYSVNDVPLNYLIGITISFNVVFSIPESDITYNYKGKAHPENDISGIENISDGYRRMTIMSFARFADDMYSKLGLNGVYL